MAKARAKAKAKAVQTRVLKTSLFIGSATVLGNDDKTHIVGGKTYYAGEPVTDIIEAQYEANRVLVNGTTPFDTFCEEVEAKAVKIELEEGEQ